MATANPPGDTVPRDLKAVNEIINRAQKGDESTLPVLRELLNSRHIIEAYGNLAHHAEETLIRKFTGKNLAVREGISRKLDTMRTELAGQTPTPLERLLVERIMLCWLHLHQLENIYAEKDSMTFDLGIYYQRCLDRAHKRYLSAIKTLAVIRKLAVPVLQVNIAKKQVNVAGSCVAPDTDQKRKGEHDA